MVKAVISVYKQIINSVGDINFLNKIFSLKMMKLLLEFLLGINLIVVQKTILIVKIFFIVKIQRKIFSLCNKWYVQ